MSFYPRMALQAIVICGTYFAAWPLCESGTWWRYLIIVAAIQAFRIWPDVLCTTSAPPVKP